MRPIESEGDGMDFTAVDPDAILEQMRDNLDLFGQALGKMQRVDNYDERLPSGLLRFSKFFSAHHKQVYSKGQSTESLHRLFQEWLKGA